MMMNSPIFVRKKPDCIIEFVRLQIPRGSAVLVYGKNVTLDNISDLLEYVEYTNGEFLCKDVTDRDVDLQRAFVRKFKVEHIANILIAYASADDFTNLTEEPFDYVLEFKGDKCDRVYYVMKHRGPMFSYHNNRLTDSLTYIR